MNKRGLVGKIFAIIGIIIIILLIIGGITARQVYSLIKTATTDGALIGKDLTEIASKGSMLTKEDCTKISEIESSIQKIKSKAQSSCKNPLIKIAVDKMSQVPIKCKDISTLELQMNQGLEPVKTICANITLS